MILIAAASNDLAVTATAIVVCFCILAVVTIVHFNLCTRGRHIERELTELHARRMERVRAALASNVDQNWNAPQATPTYPFDGWVQLTDDAVIVAGKSFNPNETAFEVQAKDSRHFPRATVKCDGRGTVIVASHGQLFRVTFANGHRTVEQILPPQR